MAIVVLCLTISLFETVFKVSDKNYFSGFEKGRTSRFYILCLARLEHDPESLLVAAHILVSKFIEH